MPSKFELARNNEGKFAFSLKAANGEVILYGEEYTTLQAVTAAIASAKESALLDERYDRRSSKDGKPHFVLKGQNEETIGRSQLFSSKAAMEMNIASVKENAPEAVVASDTSNSPLDEEAIADLGSLYGAEPIEGIEKEDLDLEDVYRNVLDAFRESEAGNGFKAVALERRISEVEIIKQDAEIFKEIAELMRSVNERYRVLTGLPPKERG